MIRLTPAVNFINIIQACFSYECPFGSFYYVHVTRKKAAEKTFVQKSARIMLMKLTPGFPLDLRGFHSTNPTAVFKI
jgi:hypothetical protein